jgi:hypothetical protein
MTASAGFLIYAALYRLTVLAVGALAIWLGFRLFNNAGSSADDSAGSVSAEGNGFKLALTSILPGTYFALFGTVIISIMLWRGEPQLDQKNVVESGEKGIRVEQTSSSRVDSNINLNGIDQEWKKLDKPGLTLADAADPLSNIARIWQKENRIGEAAALARLAALYGKEEGKAEHLALLAELLRANGDEEEAAKTEQAAAALRRQGQ